MFFFLFGAFCLANSFPSTKFLHNHIYYLIVTKRSNGLTSQLTEGGYFMYTANPNGPKYISEAVLISQKIVPYLYSLGYQHLNSHFRALHAEIDVVAYLDQEKLKPYVVVEVKRKLPDDITLLDPAVQYVFSAAISLGSSVRYLLVTDGNRYYWFERSAGGQAIVRLHEAPEVTRETGQKSLLTQVLIPVTDPELFKELMQSVMQALFREGVGFGLRMGIEINRILIAKLRDEQILQSGGSSIFYTSNKDIHQVAYDVRQLYQDALVSLEGQVPNEGLWFLSPPALFTVISILEPYALSTVTASIRSHLFWQLFSDFFRIEGGVHTTPLALADLLVQLAWPRPGERILDPACGTGLFLIQAYRHMEAQRTLEQAQNDYPMELDYPLWRDIVGVEWNAEVAELAGTNFALNGISPKQIVKTNVLDRQELQSSNIQDASFDIVLLDPPIGVTPRDEHLLEQFAIAQSVSRVTLEMLFVEQSLKLLRQDGLLAVLLPDAFLSSSTYSRTRDWILEYARPRAIISLPSHAFAPVGHAGKASLLLLRKGKENADNEPVYIADVQSIEYDKFGRATAPSSLTPLIKSVRIFLETQQIEIDEQENKLQVWSVSLKELREKSWSAAQLRPPKPFLSQNSQQVHYDTVQLRTLVEIFSGQSFPHYIERGNDTAIVLRAGAIRDLTLDLSDAPYISLQDYYSAKRAQVQVGDILVTSTGQYLGRACTIDALPIPAVVNNNVTILRPLPSVDIDHFFLAAVISSDLGKQQIAQRQIMSGGKPFIRRDDLGMISIPLPGKKKQQAIATHLREMISTIQKLTQLTQQIEAATKELVITELFAGDDDA